MILQCYYFGCGREPGHYWFGLPRGTYEPTEFPLKSIDGLFAPRNDDASHSELPNGVATITHINGAYGRDIWTVLAFWDNSVDKRGGCNSNFVMTGRRSFEDACRIAREHFPNVWARFAFEVKLYEAKTL